MSDANVDLAAGDARMSVDTGTGRVTSFRIGEHEVLTPGAHFGEFPMAPWCGRMRDGVLTWRGTVHEFPRNDGPHAIHGLVRQHPWEIRGHSEASIVLTQRLAPPWPFPGEVTRSIELTPESASFGMTVTAESEPFPAQAGWHPWFARRLNTGGDLELDFEPAWQEHRGPDHLPDGTRIPPLPGPRDDCFGMPDGVRATLTWPGALELTVTSPLEWVVIYDMPADSVCVEPQSGPPDGLNTLPRAVTPESPLRCAMRWRWRSLEGVE
ncbi:aldose 1-epimerase [Nocardia sp. NBC_01503]|uniref:aldose epimerase family protein n=1 Tax=Nocardia sp. NBC_01503 TaxID=2975997 RepID=UPI002E7B8F61|nr:aldose 1-epimerase [Nocardia sp. NBC_01503]WTL33317.1 aldose 1-epimerase [Nocardia sp. NBC_01503]